MSDLSGLSTFYKNTTNVTVIIDSVANYFDNVMREDNVMTNCSNYSFSLFWIHNSLKRFSDKTNDLLA